MSSVAVFVEQKHPGMSLQQLREQIEVQVTSVDIWLYEVNDEIRKIDSCSREELVHVLARLEFVGYQVDELKKVVQDMAAKATATAK